MATLIAEARAARDEARQLRSTSDRMRRSSRAKLVTTHTRLAVASAAMDEVRVRRDTPWPSPWSALAWNRADAALERALVLFS